MNYVPVSVIIPCFRNSVSVHRAVESVFQQTWRPAELILIDDKSPDDTLTTLYALKNGYDAGWIKVLALHENVGPGSARNLGWKQAAEPHIAFLDADDAWHPHKIEIQLSWMLAHPNAALSGHAYRVRADSGRHATQPIDVNAIEVERLVKRRLLLSNPISTSTVMVRRDVAFRFTDGKRHCEDFLLWCRIGLAGGPCYLIQSPLTFLYKSAYGDSGLSGNLWLMERGELDSYAQLYKASQVNLLEVSILYVLSLAKYVKRVVSVQLRKMFSR